MRTQTNAAELNWATRRLISQLGCGPKLGQYRGCRAGRHVQQRRMYTHTPQTTIPVITTRCRQFCDQSYSNSLLYHGNHEKRTSVLQQVNCHQTLIETHTRRISTAAGQFIPFTAQSLQTPLLYVMNVAALTKPHAPYCRPVQF